MAVLAWMEVAAAAEEPEAHRQTVSYRLQAEAAAAADGLYADSGPGEAGWEWAAVLWQHRE